MIVFSLQRNKLWNGSGFLVKQGSLELSSLCFAEQTASIGSGKYRVKFVGASLSGNGTFFFQLFLANNEILSKTLVFNGRANTEVSFDMELFSPGPYKIKLSRGKESLGRISINLMTLFKTVEKKETAIISNHSKTSDTKKTFFLIDYDNLKQSDIPGMFLNLKNYSNCSFLLKAEESFVEMSGSNYRYFFEWSNIFDYLSLYDSKKTLYLDGNIPSTIFEENNFKTAEPITNTIMKSNQVHGMIF